jgi:hypothetical protein
MPNHFHLVVGTTQPELSAGLQRLNGLHAIRFNRRYDRVGHLFQGRFEARVLEEDDHSRTRSRTSLQTRSAAVSATGAGPGAGDPQLNRFSSPRACWFQGTRWVVPAAPTRPRFARYQSYVSISVCAFESRGSQPSSRSALPVETNESR